MINVNEFEKKQILFVFLNLKEKVSFSNDNIVIKNADGSIKHQSTCYRLFLLFVIGNITITNVIIQKAHKFGFVVVLMTSSMKVYDFIGNKMEGNVLLRQQQYKYNDNKIAKHILANKIFNQRTLLMEQRDKSTELKTAIGQIDGYLNDLLCCEGNIQSLLGYEGSAARIYFKNHFTVLPWSGRRPRIKSDYINSTLDIGYTILFNLIDALLQVYGFDVYCGVLHKQFYMRKSLVCDLVEPFRVLIDRQVKKAVRLGQFKEDDFNVFNHRYVLKWENNAKYVGILMEPLMKNKREIFLYIQAYYRCFMKQKNLEEYPVFSLR